MKKKKLIAGVISVAVIIGLAFLLAYTFFALREIEVDFRTSKTNFSASNEEIVKSSGIETGGTVFFRNKQEYADNIEEEYAYLNVINIETVFPNKFVIHVVERQEVYAVRGEDYFYICDEELRVLRTTENFVSDQTNAMLLTGKFSLENLKVGEYISEIDNPMIYQSLFECNRALGAQQSFIQEIRMTREFDSSLMEDVDTLTLSLYSGQTVVIANYKVALSYKAHLMMEVYSKLFDMVGKESLQKDETKAVLTVDNLKDCEIYINNYYTNGENIDLEQENCYFKIFITQEI